MILVDEWSRYQDEVLAEVSSRCYILKALSFMYRWWLSVLSSKITHWCVGCAITFSRNFQRCTHYHCSLRKSPFSLSFVWLLFFYGKIHLSVLVRKSFNFLENFRAETIFQFEGRALLLTVPVWFSHLAPSRPLKWRNILSFWNNECLLFIIIFIFQS